VTAKALCRCIGQALQAIEVELAMVAAEDLRRIISNRRELTQIHGVIILNKLLSDLFGQYVIVTHKISPNQ